MKLDIIATFNKIRVRKRDKKYKDVMLKPLKIHVIQAAPFILLVRK